LLILPRHGVTNRSPTVDHLDRAARLADEELVRLMLGAAFPLGCRELYDSDLWWHLRERQ
jgi:hypothetical protein